MNEEIPKKRRRGRPPGAVDARYRLHQEEAIQYLGRMPMATDGQVVDHLASVFVNVPDVDTVRRWRTALGSSPLIADSGPKDPPGRTWWILDPEHPEDAQLLLPITALLQREGLGILGLQVARWATRLAAASPSLGQREHAGDLFAIASAYAGAEAMGKGAWHFHYLTIILAAEPWLDGGRALLDLVDKGRIPRSGCPWVAFPSAWRAMADITGGPIDGPIGTGGDAAILRDAGVVLEPRATSRDEGEAAIRFLAEANGWDADAMIAEWREKVRPGGTDA